MRASSTASALATYEKARLAAWDTSRRFKALFKAEVSPKVGAIGRGYLSVWWNGATGTLHWRASAPIAGSGRGKREGGATDAATPDPSHALLPGRFSSDDLLGSLCIRPHRLCIHSKRHREAGGRVSTTRNASPCWTAKDA